MKKLVLLIIIVALAAAAWIFYDKQEKPADITAIVVTDTGRFDAVKTIVDESFKEAALPGTRMDFIYLTVEDSLVNKINAAIASKGASIIIADASYNSMIAPFVARSNILVAETEDDNDIMEAVTILTDAYNVIKSRTQSAPTITGIKEYIATTIGIRD